MSCDHIFLWYHYQQYSLILKNSQKGYQDIDLQFSTSNTLEKEFGTQDYADWWMKEKTFSKWLVSLLK